MTEKERAYELLGNFGRDCKNYGLSEGDILIAIGKKRDQFDSFGILCNVYGYLIKYLGSFVVLLTSVISWILLIRWLAQQAVEFGTWIGSIKEKGILGTILADEEQDLGAVGRIGGAAVEGFILGLMPPPVAAIANVAVNEVSRALGGGSREYGLGGGSTGASTSPFIGPKTEEEAKKEAGSSGMLGKIWNWITGKNDGSFSDYDVRQIAAAAGCEPREVRDFINAQD